MEEMTDDLRKPRWVFSTVGVAFSALILAAFLGNLVISLLPRLIWGGENPVSQTSWWKWLLSFAPMYLLAFPTCYLVLRKQPVTTVAKQKLTGKQFMTLLPICFFLMYAGNLAGTVLSLLFSWGTAENALNEFAMDDSPLKVLVMVVLAPVFEELICRKVLVDRVRRFGEKNAVLLSGLVFGLLHQNLYQFFYAFALGCVFAYVYLRTGRLRYPVIFHMIINFMGSVVAPFVLSNLDLELLEKLGTAAVTKAQLLEFIPGFLLYLAYSMVFMGLSVLGLILFLIKRRSLIWKETEEQLPQDTAAKTTWLNPGMLLYTALCLAGIVMALL